MHRGNAHERQRVIHQGIKLPYLIAQESIENPLPNGFLRTLDTFVQRLCRERSLFLLPCRR